MDSSADHSAPPAPPARQFSPRRKAILEKARTKALEVRKANAMARQREIDVEKEIVLARRQARERELAALMPPPPPSPPKDPEPTETPVEETPVTETPQDPQPSQVAELPPPPPKKKAQKAKVVSSSSESESEEDYSTPPKRKGAPKHLQDYWRAKTELLKAQAEFHRANAAQALKKEVAPMSHEAAVVNVAKGVIRNKAQDQYKRMAWASLFPGQAYPDDGY